MVIESLYSSMEKFIDTQVPIEDILDILNDCEDTGNRNSSIIDKYLDLFYTWDKAKFGYSYRAYSDVEIALINQLYRRLALDYLKKNLDGKLKTKYIHLIK